MSICFHGSGTIKLKKENKDEFAKKFLEIAKPYDSNMSFMCNDDGLLQFINYARHFFMSDISDMLEKNVEMIDFGSLEFICYDEDGSPKNPFSHIITLEIVDGKVYEESLDTRLPCDWEHYYADNEWFKKEYERRNKI